jgi:hypothetical protein
VVILEVSIFSCLLIIFLHICSLVGPIGAVGGYPNLGAGIPYASQCQMVADYIYGTNTGGIASGYQQVSGTGYAEQ